MPPNGKQPGFEIHITIGPQGLNVRHPEGRLVEVLGALEATKHLVIQKEMQPKQAASGGLYLAHGMIRPPR